MGAEWRTDKRESRQESKTRWKAVAVIPGRDNDDYAKMSSRVNREKQGEFMRRTNRIWWLVCWEK